MSTSESIVVSLEWAKKLKEVGWPQKRAVWFWFPTYSIPAALANQPGIVSPHWALATADGGSIVDDENIAAPTAEEILRRLPGNMLHKNRRDMYKIQITLTPRHHWRITYQTFDADVIFQKGVAAKEESETLANAAAAMWIFLMANNLLP